MYLIECHNVSYNYSPTLPALRSINMKVRQGSIYGFLGKNGAGKTTTLKILNGLISGYKGKVEYKGRTFRHHRIKILGSIGSLIEMPSIYSHLTVKQNLRVFGLAYEVSKERIEEILRLIGLLDVKGKTVHRLSLGMKQRLGIGIALLHDPELIILDEPTNGLDPVGIIDIRNLLKRLNVDYGKTIIISSHNLQELEKFATHYSIIDRGSTLFEGTAEELYNQANNQYCIIKVNDVEIAKNILLKQGVEALVINDCLQVHAKSKSETGKLVTQLVSRGVEVHELAYSNKDLESIFLHLTR
jgi:ABC-type multidrug transport system ATPase subunit